MCGFGRSWAYLTWEIYLNGLDADIARAGGHVALWCLDSFVLELLS